MKITKENIEAWLLDLSEGKLSAAQEKEVRVFLSQHPELGLSADEWHDYPTIEPMENENPNWNLLKKNSGWPRIENEKENFLIGKLEGTLTPEEENEFNNRLMNDEKLANEWVIYRSMKLVAGENEKSLLVAFLKFYSTEITSDNYRNQFIVAAETGEPARLEKVNQFISQYPFAATEWETVQSLKLVPVLTDRMSAKELLKKRESGIVFLYSRRFYAGAVSVAAVVLLFFGWGWINQNPVADTANNKTRNQNVRPDNNKSVSVENDVNENKEVNSQANTLANFVKQQRYNQVTPDTVITDSARTIIPELNTNTPSVELANTNNNDTLNQTPDKTFKAVTPVAFYNKDSTGKAIYNSHAGENANFLTMKNVVSRVSNGFIEVDRKKDDESREFYLRIGKLKFHRKKKLNNE
jgi:hypothetical protein